MRIFVDENIPQGAEVFHAYGDVHVFSGRVLRREDLREADALLVRSVTQVNENLLRDTPVRFVGTATIGVNHVDQEYLRRRNIGFASAPGCNARSVAEYVVAALLHLHAHRGLELEGKTLGIVGCGHVGRQVARLAPYLGLKVLRCDPPLATAGEAGPFMDLHELIAYSDMISLHVPLTESGKDPTRKLMNQKIFETWDRPRVLLNTCRGEVADETALSHALDSRLISHLVLDVFANEPDIHAALAERADLITPHIAGYSVQGKLNGTGLVLDAFCRHFGFEKKSAPIYPIPPEANIVFPSETKDLHSYLHNCVTKSYEIARDDAALRKTLNHADAGSHFDSMRRHYPPRHEFAGFRVTGVPASATLLRNRLSGLGFLVK